MNALYLVLEFPIALGLAPFVHFIALSIFGRDP